jgi:hypothetical protein
MRGRVEGVMSTPLLTGKKLGVLLSTPPQHPNFIPAIALIRAALDAGVNVYFYCIDEAVHCVKTPEVQELRQRGVNLFGCAYGAHQHGVTVDDSAAFSGLTVVSDIIANTDRFISFN